MRLPAILGLLLLSGILTSCGLTEVSGGNEIPIMADERADGTMFFEPKVVTVRTGEKVTFVVTNQGKNDHEFESIEEGEAGIEEVLIPAGKTRRVAWTAPSKPGTYPVYCDLPYHRELGMEFTLVVVEPTASSTPSGP